MQNCLKKLIIVFLGVGDQKWVFVDWEEAGLEAERAIEAEETTMVSKSEPSILITVNTTNTAIEIIAAKEQAGTFNEFTERETVIDDNVAMQAAATVVEEIISFVLNNVEDLEDAVQVALISLVRVAHDEHAEISTNFAAMPKEVAEVESAKTSSGAINITKAQLFGGQECAHSAIQDEMRLAGITDLENTILMETADVVAEVISDVLDCLDSLMAVTTEREEKDAAESQNEVEAVEVATAVSENEVTAQAAAMMMADAKLISDVLSSMADTAAEEVETKGDTEMSMERLINCNSAADIVLAQEQEQGDDLEVHEDAAAGKILKENSNQTTAKQTVLVDRYPAETQGNDVECDDDALIEIKANMVSVPSDIAVQVVVTVLTEVIAAVFKNMEDITVGEEATHEDILNSFEGVFNPDSAAASMMVLQKQEEKDAQNAVSEISLRTSPDDLQSKFALVIAKDSVPETAAAREEIAIAVVTSHLPKTIETDLEKDNVCDSPDQILAPEVKEGNNETVQRLSALAQSENVVLPAVQFSKADADAEDTESEVQQLICTLAALAVRGGLPAAVLDKLSSTIPCGTAEAAAAAATTALLLLLPGPASQALLEEWQSVAAASSDSGGVREREMENRLLSAVQAMRTAAIGQGHQARALPPDSPVPVHVDAEATAVAAPDPPSPRPASVELCPGSNADDCEAKSDISMQQATWVELLTWWLGKV
jgi:hypothetical protein